MTDTIEMEKVEDCGDKDVQEVIDIFMQGLFLTLKNDMPSDRDWKSYEMKVTFNAKEKKEGVVTVENMLVTMAESSETPQLTQD